MQSFVQFASRERIERLLIKERVKCCKRNGSQHHFVFDPNLSLDMHPSARKYLSTIMPPRATWVHVKTRQPFMMADRRVDIKKLNAKQIELTIRRDRQNRDNPPMYLRRLDAYVTRIQNLLFSDLLQFSQPEIVPLHKSTSVKDHHRVIVYRPLAVYNRLDDKIILSLVCRFMTQRFSRYLHTNILSYRCARPFGDERHCVTDFNDGIKLIGRFRVAHAHDTIYASDCDIRKFYDTIHHDVIIACFDRMLTRCQMDEESAAGIRRVLRAYLCSFNFHDNVLLPSLQEGFWHRAYKHHQPQANDECLFEWISDADGEQCYGSAQAFAQVKSQIGVPQGGALSLIIADVVLNDVDMEAELPDDSDINRLFVRFCDDMILLHTDESQCQRLMNQYARSLTEHKLIYHAFAFVPKSDNCPQATTRDFWHQKSHYPFLWGDGRENSNRFVGFLGYEMNRDGQIRLRHSNERKFEDKFRRFYFTVYRHMKTHKDHPTSVEVLNQRSEKSMVHLVNSLNFYEGFQDFDYTPEQLIRLDRHRRAMLRRLISRLRRLERSDYSEEQRQVVCQHLERLKAITFT